MIRPIDIRLNAAHPELPLAEAVTFTGSPSTVLIRGVPPNCGRWAITAVSVAATFPDGSTTTRAAVQSANGVWVATLPATARSGRTANGLRVIADGIDENGAAVMGYILGVADFAVASLGVTPAPEPGETSWQMLYFDAVPGTLRKGDVTKVDGVLKFYNGTAWEPFAAPITFDDAVTKDSANGVKSSGIWAAIWGALASLPTGFTSLYDWCVAQLAGKVPTSRKVNGKALTGNVTLTGADIAVSGSDATKISAALAGKASKADATLTERFSAWTFSPATIVDQGVVRTLYMGIDPATGKGFPAFDDAEYGQIRYGENRDLADTIEQIWHSGTLETPAAEDITATRTALPGYVLGSQTDKPLASEAEAEALRTGKQSALTAQQLANIAAVPNKADRAANPTAGNLAALDASGNPTDSLIPAANVAVKGNIPYDLGTTIVIDTASSETVEGETVTYAEATLINRTANVVLITVAIDELRVTLPATDGKVRDFGLLIAVDGYSAALAAPALVVYGAGAENIELMNPDGSMPELADGTATTVGATILYFSEVESSAFLVKGEQVQQITQ